MRDYRRPRAATPALDEALAGASYLEDDTLALQVLLVMGNAANLTDVAKIVFGSAHVCALMYDHTMKCRGSNLVGQLGNGAYNTDEAEPINVSGLGGDVYSTAAGSASTCAVLADSRVKCWGNYARRQAGTV